jgi:tetratricopeptide (TPR) repeat protein
VSKSDPETKQERDGEPAEDLAVAAGGPDGSEQAGEAPEEQAAAAPSEETLAADAPAETETEAKAEETADAAPREADVTATASDTAPATSAESEAKLTPGQRLAAARAKKAAKKSSERGREAEEREQKIIDTAEIARQAATSYLETHARMIAAAAFAVALAVVGVIGFTMWRGSQDDAAGALLEAANAVYLTRVEAEGDVAGADTDVDPYPSWEARADAALAKYREVTEQYPNADAAAWAWLGQGRAHLEKGEAAEARSAYEEAAKAAGENGEIQRIALEGIGFSYEAEEKWDEALSTYDELGTLQNGVFESWSDYHAARMLLRKGERDQAKERLEAALERLGAPDAPRSVFLRREVQERLALIDPSLAQQGASGGGLGADLSAEQIQELIRQAQARQQAQGSGAP